MIKVTAAIILLSSIGTAFTFTFKNLYKTQSNSNHKREEGFVVFTIDSASSVNSKKHALSFYYHDSLAEGHPVTLAGKTSQLSINSATLLFEANDKQIPFLIFPGEHITVKYAGSDSVQLSIEGNKQRTNELNFFKALVHSTGNIYEGFKPSLQVRKVSTLKQIDSSERTINVIKEQRVSFLKNYKNNFILSDNFTIVAYNLIKSAALNDSVLLYFNNQNILNSLNLYQKRFGSKLQTLRHIEFLPFQICYRTCFTLLSIISTNSVYPTIYTDGDLSKVFNSSDKCFEGPTRDFLLSFTIYKAYANRLKNKDDYLNKYNSLCKNIGYKMLVNKLVLEKDSDFYTTDLDKVLFSDGKTFQDLKFVLSKYKGKLILLDFWASWCFPCRAEMPYLNVLKVHYTNKPISIVSISTDKSIKDWVKAKSEESLEDANCFLLLNYDNSLFAKQYNINAIPRYMLINKNGEIITDNAPRPSDPRLKMLIDENL